MDTGMSTNELKQLSGTSRLAAHPLNRRGLHAMRALIAQRLSDKMHSRVNWEARPEYASAYRQYMKDGLVVHQFPARPQPKDNATHLLGLLRMVSGYTEEMLLPYGQARAGSDHVTFDDLFTDFSTTKRQAGADAQTYLHTDTFQPTWTPAKRTARSAMRLVLIG